MVERFEMILEIFEYPDPILKGPFKPVDEDYLPLLQSMVPQFHKTIKTLKAYGVAAPQVGMNRTFLFMDLSRDPKSEHYPQNQKIICVCNPEIISMEDPVIESEEACLSLPGVKAKVKRNSYCHVKYRDENWKEHEVVFTGLEAIIFQHEYDHLQGKLLIDHLSRLLRRDAVKKIKVFKRRRNRWG